MTKRILALLLAVLFAVSCCMMTACGDDDKKPADDKTQQGEDNKKPDDSKNPTDNNSDKKHEDDKKSGDATSGKTSDASSGGLLDDYNAADEFEGEAVDIQFYEAAKFETWTGKVGEVTWTWWQSVVSIHPDDLNVTEGLGTDDYAYKWTMHVRPADAHSTPDKEDDKWISVPCQVDTKSGVGDRTIYRPQPGTGFEGKFTIDQEYEVIYTIEGPDGKYKSEALQYFVWDQKFEDAYQNWKAGKDVNGEPANCFVPELAPHDGLTPTPRTPAA